MSSVNPMSLIHNVGNQANSELRKRWQVLGECGTIITLLLAVLVMDYTAARILFTYLDPTIGDVSMGPDILALTLPLAVIAIHLLVKERGGTIFERYLVLLAKIGVVIFLSGMGLMLALVYLDASTGLGSQVSTGIQGTLGSVDLSNAKGDDLSLLRSFFSEISPIFFFTGMALTLFITVYATHRLLCMLEERYRFVFGTSNRAKELKAYVIQADKINRQIKLTEKKLMAMRKKLPSDPEYKFAQITSAEIHRTLHRMKLSLRSLQEADDVIASVFARKATIPAYINTREEGLKSIKEIRHQTTPYEILKHLGGLPHGKENQS